MTDAARIEQLTLPITQELELVHETEAISLLTNRAEMIRNRVSRLSGLGEEELVAAAKSLWDTYVVPINLPRVPDLIEGMLKRMIWGWLEASIRGLIPDQSVIPPGAL